MVDEDRVKEDQMRDEFSQRMKIMGEIIAGMRELAKDSPTQEIKIIISLSQHIFNQIKKLNEVQMQQIEATNNLSRIIIKLKQEIEYLKSK